jgi:ApaG protein
MNHSLTSNTITEGIRVRAAAVYLPNESEPDADRFLFAYRITLSNEGTETAQLLSRHWIIINGDGDREDVEGPGVVGKYPLLEPGDVFEYTSFCPLNTAWGTMEGTFTMQRDNGEKFDVAVGRFYLAMNAPREVEAA